MAEYPDSSYLHILKNKFNFEDFKSDTQKSAIKAIMSGIYKDIIISMPANSGKSLCYLMPRFFRPSGVVLVISSHIVRITNEIEFLTKLNIPATTITSLTSLTDRNSIMSSFTNIENPPYWFFYVTPEMIVTGSESVREFIDYLLETQVCLVAVDEAHLLEDIDFRESYQELNKKRIKFPNIPWIALTTASEDTLKIIASALSMNEPFVIKESCVRTDIFLDVKPFRPNIVDLIADLIEPEVQQEDETQRIYSSGTIYCQNNEEADKVAAALCEHRIPCESYHLLKPENELILKKWKNGEFPILVTHEGTFNIGGFNKSSLKFVIFFPFPQTIRTFYQRIGKINVKGGHARIISPTIFRHNEVCNYMRIRSCRHQFIAKSIGGEVVNPCGNKCDNCVMARLNLELNGEAPI